MHEPERWPVSNAETWRSWRDYLDRIEDLPNIATLKREADCEIRRVFGPEDFGDQPPGAPGQQ